MGENSTAAAARLTFTPAILTRTEVAEASTAYQATAQGVTYRVIGTVIDPFASTRREFRAYRIVGSGHEQRTFSAGQGGAHRTRAAAYAQAEADLVEVLRDREAAVPAAQAETPKRKLIGQVSAHQDAPCTDACYEPAIRHLPQPALAAAFDRLRAAVEAEIASQQPATDPVIDDTVPELVDRIVRRAQYEALKTFRTVLAGWIEGAEDNCRAMDHG